MSNKYPGVNSSDNHFDEYHKQRGEMTNNEFFSSNTKGGFYEGTEWNGYDWVPDQASRDRQDLIDEKKCKECHFLSCVC